MNKFKKIFQNRLVLGVICIIIALAICFGLTPVYNRALSQTTDVVVVSQNIDRGMPVTADRLSILTVGGYNLPNNIATTKESIVGAYASTDLHVGDYIFPSKLQKDPVYSNEYLKTLDGTRLAVSVTIPYYAAGLSDKLEAGDIVSLIIGSAGENKSTIIPPELTYMLIIAISDDIGNDMVNSQAKHIDSTGIGEVKNSATITFLATSGQARLLVEAEQNAKLHAALVYRGDVEKSNEFIAMQAEILEQVESGEIKPTMIVTPRNDPQSILSSSSAEIEQMGVDLVKERINQ